MTPGSPVSLTRRRRRNTAHSRSDGRKRTREGNIYEDYFARLFAESAAARPSVQSEYGDFIAWRVPGGSRLTMFTSGLGDGIYSGYWGLGADGNAAELVIPFMNPEFF